MAASLTYSFQFRSLRCWLVLLAALIGPRSVDAQVVGQASTAYANTFFIAPAELFYKVQAGYERCLTPVYSLGLHAALYPGFRDLYQGWHLTLYGRRYTNQHAPFGLYLQAQASVYEHEQTTSLIHIDTRQYGYGTVAYRWSGRGAGAGIGLGYRLPVMQRAFHGHLSVDGMLGARFNWRPQAPFDATTYRVAGDFLPDGFEWFFVGPGSLAHGLLTAGYSF